MKLIPVLLALTCLSARLLHAETLTLSETRAHPTDLEVAGFPGIPEGASRFLSWDQVAALPGVRSLEDTTDWLDTPQKLEILPLEALWQALGREESSDALVADCADGYQSHFPASYLDEGKPFLILRINGLKPEDWPRGPLSFWPGPFVISVSSKLAPEAAADRHASHKRPFAVARLSAVNWATFTSGLGATAAAGAPPPVARGRDLYLLNCASCHNVDNRLGGSFAQRQTVILAVFARTMPDYFNNYVRNPTSVRPDSRMPASPFYLDSEIQSLRAFLTSLHPQ